MVNLKENDIINYTSKNGKKWKFYIRDDHIDGEPEIFPYAG